MPGSRLVVFDEAGHFPHHQDPDRFIEILDGFIADTDPVRFDRSRWRRLLREGRPRPGAVEGDEGEGPRHLELVVDPAPAAAV
jgi:hypothetical protein